MNFSEWLSERFAAFEALVSRGVVALETIAAAAKSLAEGPFPATGTAVNFKIYIGGTMGSASPVPISDLPAGTPVVVIGMDGAGALGAQLAAGAKIAMSVDNQLVATFVPDPSPVPQPTTNPDGSAGAPITPLITGKLVAATPLLLDTVANVSYDITNADGSDGGSGSAAFEPVVGTETSAAIVFGVPLPTAPPVAAGARRPAPAAGGVRKH
jgi:hypothetical protein